VRELGENAACAQGGAEPSGHGDGRRVWERIRGNLRRQRIGVYFEEPVWEILRNDERDALPWAVWGQGEAPVAWEDARMNP
jgi:hypothetical protein